MKFLVVWVTRVVTCKHYLAVEFQKCVAACTQLDSQLNENKVVKTVSDTVDGTAEENVTVSLVSEPL